MSTVLPQLVNNGSILNSAIGFISDVTQSASSQHSGAEAKETVLWACLETGADLTSTCVPGGNVDAPLILILGYETGFQIWSVLANGDAIEVISRRRGSVPALRILPTPQATLEYDEYDRPTKQPDDYSEKRPLIALIEKHAQAVGSSGSIVSGGGGGAARPCSVSFISLRTGEQVKVLPCKNEAYDVRANQATIVITFKGAILILDPRTLAERFAINGCYPSPGIYPNPIALGTCWLAYASDKLIPSMRSLGGFGGETVPSYTTTVINAAKTFTNALFDFGANLRGASTSSNGGGTASSSKSSSSDSGMAAVKDPGVITIMDVKNSNRNVTLKQRVQVHFVAHSDAIVAMEFDPFGQLLVTADNAGHDFHVFRIQASPLGSNDAAVHHMYVLHRGDTSATVQDIAITKDSRWTAISTLRGTTHVFPIAPYGGPISVRTHTSALVVNQQSRFQRSAGIPLTGATCIPQVLESLPYVQSKQPFNSPLMPPFPRPAVVKALAQLRQTYSLSTTPGLSSLASTMSSNAAANGSRRVRHSSVSDENGKSLVVCATFAKSRSALTRSLADVSEEQANPAMLTLFVMSGHGALIQYNLYPKPASYIAKEKIDDDSPIELEFEAKAQWNICRRVDGSQDILPPLPSDSLLLRNGLLNSRMDDISEDRSDDWLSQVEILTHDGPHRRLWMGPQFTFYNYDAPSGSSNIDTFDATPVDIAQKRPSTNSSSPKLTGIYYLTNCVESGASLPMNIPQSKLANTGGGLLHGSGSCGSALPILIGAGSVGQSPKMVGRFGECHPDSDRGAEQSLKEILADAMLDMRPEFDSSSYDEHENGPASWLVPDTFDAQSHRSNSSSSSDEFNTLCKNPGNNYVHGGRANDLDSFSSLNLRGCCVQDQQLIRKYNNVVMVAGGGGGAGGGVGEVGGGGGGVGHHRPNARKVRHNSTNSASSGSSLTSSNSLGSGASSASGGVGKHGGGGNYGNGNRSNTTNGGYGGRAAIDSGEDGNGAGGRI